jgi:GxxExxY protein
METNQVTERIIGAAIDVHRELGPGLLESTYEACIVFELEKRGLAFERQLAIPVLYKGARVDCGYRIDLLVENCVIVELKCVEKLHPIHKAQMLSYLKSSGHKVGLILNFNVPVLVKGIERVVHGFNERRFPATMSQEERATMPRNRK